ncbi:MAG: glycosyl hydrolase [Myxococcales bacterium]|nr:glycosyl hydrolase [Myxococcales bacterium]
MRQLLARVSVALAFAVVAVACGDDANGPTGTGAGAGPTVGAGPGGGGGQGAGSMSSSGSGGAGGDGGAGPLLCPTTITFEGGAPATNVRVAGEWQGFDLATAAPMAGPTAGGEFTAMIDLPPGLHAYKIVYDDGVGGTSWVLNPTEGRRKYVDGIENSAVKVRDCSLPTLTVDASEVSRPAPGQGTFTASLAYVAPVSGSGASPAGFTAELLKDDTSSPLSSAQLSVAANGATTVSLGGLSDGKYRLVLRPQSQDGATGEPVRLVFWVEAEPFDWRDALIYMVMTDRYRDGDPSNNAAPTPNADPRGDWMGGDLEGLRLAIAEGKLDQLGVRAIWLTPFQTNPTSAYPASDGVHQVTGYHGYWPIKSREVDPRIGGEAALRALVKEAHAHGIRILQDYVVNHVHEGHEYVSAHPDWFRTGCVCGTQDCDWTAHALDCMFASYMPDIDHTVPEANAQIVADAIWWLDELDLDGLRVDAVKHVEEVATRNLAAEVRETFEPSGLTRYFLMGETAMGWSDCADPCNDENYGTISKYVGPYGLDGQFDFVLYHGVSYRTFAYGDSGMLHADYWLKHGLSKWPSGAVMTPYIGSHDTARFTSLADYRGQDAAHDRGIPGNQWSNTAVAPTDAEPYRRTRLGMAWLLNLPGAPLLYYGDEYGQWGGADPNNRLFFRPDAALSAEETATLAFVRKLGQARRDVPALRRGAYVSLAVTEDTLIFGRKIAQGAAAIVGLTRSAAPVQATFDVNGALGWPPGMVLTDELGGPGATVAGNGSLTVTVPASGALVLRP